MPAPKCRRGRVVIVTGAESSGKSTLVAQLAADGGLAIAEVARDYLSQSQARDYQSRDLLQIAQRQFSAEIAYRSACELTIADTDGLVIELWWRERFGKPAPEFHDLLSRWLRLENRFYLLCRPDLIWEPDPLRENPGDRERLFGWHERRLQGLAAARGIPVEQQYGIVSGWGNERLTNARRLLASWCGT